MELFITACLAWFLANSTETVRSNLQFPEPEPSAGLGLPATPVISSPSTFISSRDLLSLTAAGGQKKPGGRSPMLVHWLPDGSPRGWLLREELATIDHSACKLCHLVMSDSLSSMDCSPPGSSVHGILQARILEWVAMPSSRGSSRPRDRTRGSYISCIGQQVLLPLGTPGKPVNHNKG